MDFIRTAKQLVCNPVYIVTCLGACMELSIVSGFVVYLPKYLETQFSLGKSQASVFTGGIAVPGACIGIFMGGCLLKRLQLRPKGAVQFVLCSNILCLAFYALLFFLGCDNVKMAGTTMPSKPEPFQVNLTAACNFGCECLTSDVEPVCGNNGLTYFSPCHAGCTALSSHSNYTNCACIHGNLSALVTGTSMAATQFAEVTMVPVATAGPCNSPCQTIFPFLILLFFMTSVGEDQRSFALGVQFVIFRLFGYIPAPILFGSLIDSTCLLWKNTCGERGGRCLLYDIEEFRYKYVGLCAVIKLIALTLFVIDWNLVRKRQALDKQGPAVGLGEIIGSIISIDKHCKRLFVCCSSMASSSSSCAPAATSVGGGGAGHSHGHRRQESNVSMYAMTGLYSGSASEDAGDEDADEEDERQQQCAQQHVTQCGRHPQTSPPFSGPSTNTHTLDRQVTERHKAGSPALVLPQLPPPAQFKDCGFLACRPAGLQRFANIKVFVLLLSLLVTLQQALASGYISSVITTIEKRFEIPSSHSGLIASSYEIGNVFTVIFVSYLGSRKHIPIWIGIGSLIMGVGSMVFMVPHFTAEPPLSENALNLHNNSENICRGVSVREQDMGLGPLSSAGLSSPPLSPGNNLRSRADNCISSSPSTTGPVLLFLLAQLLLGCGGAPLFTLGTTYIDDHVHPESAAIYIGIMYSMAAFGPVCGFLLGAYLLSFHMDSLSSAPVLIVFEERRGSVLCEVSVPQVHSPTFLSVQGLQLDPEEVVPCLQEEKETTSAPPQPSTL
ncbi:hypothetical protein B566_EDAN005930 [Ephemera danica]|nr:hypothetical protein B566_EDAN005930 [Ephemera danica]